VNASELGYFLIAILVGFAGVIYFSLNARKNFLEENLQLSPDQVWKQFANRSDQQSLPSKADLIFGIWGDRSSTTVELLVKNHENEVIGRVEFPMGSRTLKISAGIENYDVDFPLTWNRIAILRAADNQTSLASYLRLNVFGMHQFEIPGYGTLVSKRPQFSFRFIFDYQSKDHWVGTRQELSAERQVGRLAVLPSSMPLHFRIFILAV
jgi:hypothetical protein